mmetsp:Transcript_3906/g.12804  ORF Transcript_3906/g.12804 Transcript_3906/m.12804 type:complete len:256 (-) Transcript_3906:15-782(-)
MASRPSSSSPVPSSKSIPCQSTMAASVSSTAPYSASRLATRWPASADGSLEMWRRSAVSTRLLHRALWLPPSARQCCLWHSLEQYATRWHLPHRERVRDGAASVPHQAHALHLTGSSTRTVSSEDSFERNAASRAAAARRSSSQAAFDASTASCSLSELKRRLASTCCSEESSCEQPCTPRLARRDSSGARSMVRAVNILSPSASCISVSARRTAARLATAPSRISAGRPSIASARMKPKSPHSTISPASSHVSP